MRETEFQTRPLDAETWPDFTALVERNNGVWGGCWCMGFHSEGVGRDRSPEQNRIDKQRRVIEGRAHAALVYSGDECVGWCQFGTPDELPRMKSAKAYNEGLTDLPIWRITCFYVGKGHRGKGVADAALDGALREIGALGGGSVESYPEDVADRKTSGSFLHNATLSMFERHGFHRDRKIGKNRWVVRRTVSADR